MVLIQNVVLEDYSLFKRHRINKKESKLSNKLRGYTLSTFEVPEEGCMSESMCIKIREGRNTRDSVIRVYYKAPGQKEEIDKILENRAVGFTILQSS